MKGFLIGSAIWFVLNLFIFIPRVGWIIAWFVAPAVGGYAAAKYGGVVSAFLLVILAPLVIALLGFSLLSMILPSLIPSFLLEIALAMIVVLWASFSVLFVVIGGAVEISDRKSEQVQVSAVSPQHFAGPAYAATPSQPQVQSTLRYCIYCGAQSITQNRVFCPICGKQQT